MEDKATPAEVRLTESLGPLPEPLRHKYGQPLHGGYSADQMSAERERCYALGAAAERERCARLVETQDTNGDNVGGWFELLAAKIRA